MMDDTVFRMIEIDVKYGVQKEMKKVLKNAGAGLPAICSNVRKDRIVDDGCCTLTKD